MKMIFYSNANKTPTRNVLRFNSLALKVSEGIWNSDMGFCPPKPRPRFICCVHWSGLEEWSIDEVRERTLLHSLLG